MHHAQPWDASSESHTHHTPSAAPSAPVGRRPNTLHFPPSTGGRKRGTRVLLICCRLIAKSKKKSLVLAPTSYNADPTNHGERTQATCCSLVDLSISSRCIRQLLTIYRLSWTCFPICAAVNEAAKPSLQHTTMPLQLCCTASRQNLMHGPPTKKKKTLP